MEWYKESHRAARFMPAAGFETALVELLNGLSRYAEAHATRYESPLAEDGVLGPAWLDAVKATHVLLNGELGRLDGGLTSSELDRMARDAGFEQGLDE